MKNKLIVALTLVLVLMVTCLIACQPDIFTVTFAGDGVSVPAQNVSSGGTAIEPKNPEREGYTFKYWYNQDQNTPFDFSTPITTDITLTAFWQKNDDSHPTKVTVTFAGEGVNITAQSVDIGSTAIEPKAPIREGFTFKYWYNQDQNTPFDFNTPITQDITLTAFWQEGSSTLPTDITGSGTNQDPYVLYSAAHLVSISKFVNDGNADYVAASYKLGADIDLTGISYVPIGTLEHPFEGVFNGDNHTIVNLELTANIRSDGVKLYGLFGMTETAVVSNIKLQNVKFDIQSYRDSTETSVYIGAVAGYASLTNFTNISVNGSISTLLMANNTANIGGIAGWLSCSSQKQAYIAYTENCFVDIEMGVGEDGGEIGSLENGRVGGLFGVVNTQNCSVAILNSAVKGSIYGGQYVGGIAGYINGLVSVIDCFNTADIEATSVEVSYTGGIVGSALGDNLIMDCVSIGTVKGVKAAPGTIGYKSYAGGIVGYAEADDYEYYYVAGTSVVNSYYVTSATGADNITVLGSNEYAKAFFSKLNNIVSLTNWNPACWTTVDSVIKPTSVTAKDAQEKYTLTLVKGSNSSIELDKSTDTGTFYSLVGALDELEADGSNIFWNWQIENNVNYKYYAPVCKNMTLTAKWQDVSGIANTYIGTGTLHETVKAGSIILFADGTLQWITDSVVTGTYKFDGTRILMVINSDVGGISGIINDKNLTFYVDAGMSGTVTYSFDVYKPTIIGEYMSEAGNLLTFTGEDRVSYENGEVNNGNYFSGTYTIENATTLKTTFVKLDGYNIVASKVVLGEDDTVTLYYTQNGVDKTEVFTKLGTVDYSDEKFVGEYSYVSVSSYNYASAMRLKLDADGTVHVISEFSDTLGRYYYIPATNTLKIICIGYASNITWDEQNEIAYGVLMMGGSALKPSVFTKIDRGEQLVYTNYEYSYKPVDYDYVFIYSLPDANYVFINTVYHPELAITTPLGHGKDVTVNGVKYRISGMELQTVNPEEGTYTFGTHSIKLDGIQTATVDGKDYYYVAHKSDKIVDIIFGDELISVNWQSAQANNGAAQQLTLDGYQGIWYSPSTYGDGQGNPYYNRLVFDGSGHAALFYTSEGNYRLNWSPWGSYTVTPYGLNATFNEYHANYKFVFYYDKQVAYSTDYDEKAPAFAAKGYTGTTQPPQLPSEKIGSYVNGTGQDQKVLNIRADLSGTYIGNPIYNVVYDGANKLFFTANGINFEFVLTANGGTLKQSGDISGTELEFTLSSDIQLDVIPSALCGMWTGTFEGHGVGTKEDRGFSIERDGRIKYYTNVAAGTNTEVSNVAYDASTLTITFTDNGGFNWTFVYDVEKETITAEGKDSENRAVKATLTKTSA